MTAVPDDGAAGLMTGFRCPSFGRTASRSAAGDVPVRYQGQWLEHVRLLNVQSFAEHPLPDSEYRSIAKSCAGYSLRQYSEAEFSEIQTAHNTKRWHPDQPNFDYRSRAETAALMFKLGFTKPELATYFGVSMSTIKRDLAKANTQSI